uniref:E2F5 n=1 Tax=Stichopus japonicus TaxID=307972 RepID=A0A7D0H3C4_STIJA|nr:E2F5 [Apostichopus japonicus]
MALAASGGTVNSPQSRHEKSLGLLTTRFVELLQEAQDGVLDLKNAADKLAVRQKRRIYDITNVLEGIGLIEKKSKNSIQWKGGGPGTNTKEASERVEILKQEISTLDEVEAELDQQHKRVNQSIRNVQDDQENSRLAYVTHEDLCKCFKGDTLLAIKAPSGTQLEVPVPEVGPDKSKRYQIHLKSHNGAIYVILVNKDDASSPPVVVPVPPQDPQVLSAVAANSGASTSLASRLVPAADVTPSHPSGHNLRSSRQRGVPLATVQIKEEPVAEEKPTIVEIKVESPEVVEKSPAESLSDLHREMLLDDSYTTPFVDDLFELSDYAPFLSLLPPPTDHDYHYNLEESEGVTDVFDIPLLMS